MYLKKLIKLNKSTIQNNKKYRMGKLKDCNSFSFKKKKNQEYNFKGEKVVSFFFFGKMRSIVLMLS